MVPTEDGLMLRPHGMTSITARKIILKYKQQKHHKQSQKTNSTKTWTTKNTKVLGKEQAISKSLCDSDDRVTTNVVIEPANVLNISQQFLTLLPTTKL